MNENPFETGSNKSNPFDQRRNGSNKLKVLVMTIVVIIAIIVVGGIVKDKYQQYKFEQAVDNLTTTDILEDLDVETLQASKQSFIGDESLVGQGEDVTLNAKDATDVFEDLEDGTSYRYNEVVQPGLYTVKFKAGENIKFGTIRGLRTISYQLGLEREGYIMTDFYNIAIDGSEELFIESFDKDFELEFIPQSDYIQFDSNDIKPGVYVAGQSIESGKYNYSSATLDPVIINLQTEEEVKLISSEDYPSFKLEEGDSIVIDDENTVITKA